MQPIYFAFLNGGEFMLVLLVVAVLFGATRLPQIGQSLGESISHFRKAITGQDKD